MSDVLGSLTNLASNLRLGPWAWAMQPASWNGIRFVVRSSTIRRGRRTAVHEYAFSDVVWVEDLGRATRVISFTGFLVGDDVFAQRKAMADAAEIAGAGTLVHPSLGRIQASLIEFTSAERAELGRVVELEFSFIESSKQPVFPSAGFASSLQSVIAAAQTGLAVARDFYTTVTSTISGVQAGITFASNLFASVRGAVTGFISLAGTLAQDPGALAGSVAGLQGGNYGRDAAGARSAPQPATATVASVIAAATVARSNVGTASQAVAAANSDPSALPAAAQALTEAVRAVAQSPADQIRILSGLAAYQPPAAPAAPTAAVAAAIVTVTAATGTMLRSAALISIGSAISAYAPASYDEAMAVLESVSALLDAESVAAADNGMTGTYVALRALLAAVSDYLLTEAAQLPRLRTVRMATPMPSLTLAYALYGDAARSDDLIARADPVAPLFMPTTFKALAS